MLLTLQNSITADLVNDVNETYISFTFKMKKNFFQGFGNGAQTRRPHHHECGSGEV